MDGNTLVKYGPSMMDSIGSVAGGLGSIANGVQARKAAKYEADQYEEQGKAAYAKGTKDVIEEQRKAAILESNAIAAGAASGGAFDEGMIETVAGIKSEGEYNSLAAMFDAESEQYSLMNKANATRRAGDLKQAQGIVKGLNTVITGGNKAFETYKGYKSDKMGKKIKKSPRGFSVKQGDEYASYT